MTKNKTKSWLSYVNLSDPYERKARFIPGLLSLLFLLPSSSAFDDLFSRWIEMLIAGIGVGAVISVGISHLSSAAGNRMQEKLWPRWPYDSPTNTWLHPDGKSRSGQQKTLWYAAIKRLTNLDIEMAIKSGKQEIAAVINDAISTLRYRLRNSKCADRLNVHNVDYGFARNFLGLRSLWLSFAVISCVVTLVSFIRFDGSGLSCFVSAGLLIFSFILAFFILPGYVRQKANYYAESFFSAVMELDAEK